MRKTDRHRAKTLTCEGLSDLVALVRGTPLAVTLLLANGCATPTTGIVPTGEGAYVVTHQGNGAWAATSELRSDAVREANDYCRQQGKTIKIIHTKEVQARAFGGWPEAEVVFSCS